MGIQMRRIDGANIASRVQQPKQPFRPLSVIDECFDRRRFRRVEAEVLTRFNYRGEWFDAEVENISGGGVAVRTESRPSPFSKVMFQIRGIGMVRALITDWNSQGFRAKFFLEDLDREAVIEALTMLANRGLLLGAGK